MPRFGLSRRQRTVSLAEVTGREGGPHGLVAQGLAEARDLGLEVTPAYVLETRAFQHAVRHLLPPGHDPAALLRAIHRPRGVDQAARCRELLLALEPDDVIARQIEKLGAALVEKSELGWIASASPRTTDYDAARVAGLLGTRTGLFGDESLWRAVRELWALTVCEAALTYLRARRHRDVAMAVVVTPLIDARVTGRLFTREPGLSDDGMRLVLARHGLGLDERWLDRREVVRLDRNGSVVLRLPAVQERQWLATKEGVRTLPVVPAQAPLLSENSLQALHAIARSVEPLGHFDIRFAVDLNEKIVVVGFHRLVGHGAPSGGSGATRWARLALDATGAGPLTTLSRDVATRVGRQRMVKTLSLRQAPLSRSQPLVAIVRGRAFENLSALLAPTGDVEPFDRPTVIELAGAIPDVATFAEPRPRRSLARLGITVARLASETRRLELDVDRFDRDAEQQRRWLGELDLAILPDDALKTTLREGREFFALASALWFDCAAALGAAHTELLALFDRRDPAAAFGLLLRVVAGVGDLPTMKPGLAFGHVLEIARREPDAAAWLLAHEGSDWRALPEGATRRALAQLLEAFGDRALGDAELTTPRWSEDAAYWLRALSIGLRGPAVDPDAALSRARAAADRELALLESTLSFVQVRLLRELATRLREATRLRSRVHVRLAHAAAMLRTIVRDVDRRLRRLDPSLMPDAAFYCTFDELIGAVGSYRADLGPLVRGRVEQRLADARTRELPASFVGTPPRVMPLPDDVYRMRGLGACSGSTEGRARLVDARGGGLERFEPGDVLVVSSLAPEHAPLLLLASGVVSELGAPWSEGSVLARELGVPAVVGVAGALSYLAQGERVRVDGEAGILERLER